MAVTVENASNTASAEVRSRGKSVVVKLSKLLAEAFTNGVRPGSMIDQKKVRRQFEEKFGESIPEEVNLAKLLEQVGVVHDGKVFPRAADGKNGWQALIDGLIADGHKIFSFDRVMTRHAQELTKAGISSKEVLREMMLQTPGVSYDVDKTLFAASGVGADLVRAILAVVPLDKVQVTSAEADRLLPYVEEQLIVQALKDNEHFVKSRQGYYVIVDRLTFDEDEVASVRAQIEEQVSQHGYCPFDMISLDVSATLNDCEVYEGALKKAFFQKYLAGDYEVQGLMICPIGIMVDGKSVLQGYCRSHSEVTLSQIEAVASESSVSMYQALQTLREEMVRVEFDRFVSPKNVAFEVDKVDAALSEVCNGLLCPLLTIRDFVNFPAVPGYQWNEYLLESFIRRESKRFNIITASLMPREASGVIVAKNFNMKDAVGALAMVAVNADIPADEKLVGDYLMSTKCLLRRHTELVREIVARMQSLERGNK